MIQVFTPFLTESLQMPMVCTGDSCSTRVLYLLVAFCVHVADNACFRCSGRIGNWSNNVKHALRSLCARARTHTHSFRNKMTQPFMTEVVGNRRKSWGVMGSRRGLLEEASHASRNIMKSARTGGARGVIIRMA